MHEWLAILIGCLVAGLSLALAHLLAWGKGGPLTAYIIGTACLDTGITVAGAILWDLRLALVPWIVAIVGGAVVVFCHKLRGAVEGWPSRNRSIDRLLEKVGGTTREHRN